MLIHKDITMVISTGNLSNQRMKQILGLFDEQYTTYEVLILIRIIYFLCFNVIGSVALVFAVDKTKERLHKA